MSNQSKAQRLRAKLQKLQTDMYNSPFLFEQWRKCQKQLTKLTNQSKGKQLSL